MSTGAQPIARVPVEVSNRHLHLSAEHAETLFGDAELRQLRPISQSGQFAASQVVALVGPAGRIDRVRVVGPLRAETQVEVSQTDARTLGMSAPLRNSGQLDGSSSVTLVGPRGRVTVRQGLIVQRRHIHASPRDSQAYGLAAGDMVKVRIGGPRGLMFDNVFVKVDPSYVWRLHLDTDEGNAAGVTSGDQAEVLR